MKLRDLDILDVFVVLGRSLGGGGDSNGGGTSEGKKHLP
jgi:hypothetical protein